MPGVYVCLTTDGGLGVCEATRMSKKQPLDPYTTTDGNECDSLLKSLQMTLTHTCTNHRSLWKREVGHDFPPEAGVSMTSHKSTLIPFKKNILKKQPWLVWLSG